MMFKDFIADKGQAYVLKPGTIFWEGLPEALVDAFLVEGFMRLAVGRPYQAQEGVKPSQTYKIGGQVLNALVEPQEGKGLVRLTLWVEPAVKEPQVEKAL